MAQQREWFEKDYYDILGVPSTAPEKDIKRAYKNLARKLHPDQNPGDHAAEERFKEVSGAYDVLGDAETRAFLTFVFRTATEGLLSGASQALIRDRIRVASVEGHLMTESPTNSEAAP